MFISLKGKAEKAFVPEVWLGGVPVGELWYEGRKLYPDGRVRVKDIVLGFKDGVEQAYWLHAVAAVQGGSSAGCYMKMRFKGREWLLYTTYDGLPCLRAVNGVLRFGEDEGILLQDCIGAVVEVECVVPERRSTGLRSVLKNNPQYVEERLWDLPLLPGTCVYVDGYKGQKREWAYWNNVRVEGVPSGRVYVDGWRYTATSKGRYSVKREVFVGGADVAEGDYGWRGAVNAYGGAGWYEGLYAVYPAFTKRWEVPILGVTLQMD